MALCGLVCKEGLLKVSIILLLTHKLILQTSVDVSMAKKFIITKN